MHRQLLNTAEGLENTPVVSFSSKRQFVSPQSSEKDPLIYPEKKKLQPESKLIKEFKSHLETQTERLGQQALILQLKELKKIMTWAADSANGEQY